MVLGLLLAAATTAQAQMTVRVASTTPVTIPDDNLSGVTSSLSVFAPWMTIGSVRVNVRVESALVNEPMFNGDLYVHLTHIVGGDQAGIAVLLNRVGRESSIPYGYDDTGFNLTFEDSAANGDVHRYRSTLYGNEYTAIPSPGRLTGTWSPDGREIDPDGVVGDHDRTALLAGFTGLDPNGLWTLYLADVSGGGQAKLVSWDLTLTAVPEPSACLLVVAATLLGWAGLRRRAG